MLRKDQPTYLSYDDIALVKFLGSSRLFPKKMGCIDPIFKTLDQHYLVFSGNRHDV